MPKLLSRNKKNMKIEHLTYDDSRRGESTPLPTSATRKVKHYFSAQLARLSQQENHIEQRPVTMWPRSEHSAPSDNLPEMTAYLTQERRVEKQARRGQEKKNKNTEASGTYMSLSSNKENEKKPSQLLRHKGKFTIVKEKLSLPSAANENPNTYHEKDLAKLYKFQRAIKEGKMEQVAPGMGITTTNTLTAPPRPIHNPFADPIPRPSLKKHSKQQSTTSKMAEYINTSADILEETRREIQEKFRPPFEHLHYPTFTTSRKASISSQNSDASFFCQGNDTFDEDLTTKQTASEKKSRISGQGTDPWTHTAPTKCKYCRNATVGGVRGLCSTCERDFLRSKSPKTSNTHGSNSESEIKPTPPLKDRKTLIARKPVPENKAMNAKSTAEKPLPHLPLEPQHPQKSLTYRPRPPLKDIVKFGAVQSSKANEGQNHIALSLSERKLSSNVVIESGSSGSRDEEEDEYFRRWQSKSVRDEFERLDGEGGGGFERWSDCFVDEDGDEDERPLVGGEVGDENCRGREKVRRDTRFYGFWDEILDEKRSR